MALFGLIKSEERGLLRFTSGYAKSLLQSAGLERVHCSTVGWLTPNRTPQWLARLLIKLPYSVPVVGMYSVAIGYKNSD